MNLDLTLVLLMLAAAIAMFVVNRPRMDAVALLVMVAMPFTGIITMNEALAGFADPSIILIAALFVIGEGLVMTGVARRLGDWLDAKAGGSENRLLILLMAAVGGLGSLMSSTAVVAIFIPVVLRISQNRATAPSRLMMPLSFAALISGMLTLVATAPNLVVNAELIRQGVQGFRFFSFTPFGLPLLALGIVYMLFARRLLASRTGPLAATDRRPGLQRWIDQYRLAERERRGRIGTGSPIVGKRLDELPLRSAGVNLLAIERGTGLAARVLRPTAQTELQAGDVLLADVHTSKKGSNELWDSLRLEPQPLGEIGNYFIDRSQEIGAAEVILPAESALIGQTVREARIRSEYDLTVIGLRHGSNVAVDDLLDERLKLGDTLLLIGFWSDIRELQSDMDDVVVLNMPAELTEVLPAAQRAPHALAVLGLVVALMISGVVPNVQAALIGCLLMGLLGCVDFNSAYRCINWKSLILIVGMLPFSLALQRTGGVDLAADAVLGVVGGAAPRLVLAVLFVITAALGLFISRRQPPC
jgi:di/tricarboxylate transporter